MDTLFPMHHVYAAVWGEFGRYLAFNYQVAVGRELFAQIPRFSGR